MIPRRIAYLLKVFPKVSETFIATELAELRRSGIELRILSLQRPQTGVRHDFVVTSGLGNLFPKGVPIGRVAAIQDKGSALFHFAVLAPAVDFARVEEVLLLTGQTQQDMAGLFTPDG